jgi:solute carrier family 25 aspartate/glutamate transporter 12/13
MNATTSILLLLLILEASKPFTDALVVGLADASTMSTLSSTALLLSTSIVTTISSLPPVIVPPFLIHTAAGALAGSAGALAAYPIDYVKSQLQTERGRAEYQNGWDAAFRIVQQDGPTALYRGAWVNVLGVAPEKTIKLGTNAYVIKLLRQGLVQPDAAAAAASTATLPLPLEQQVLAGAIAGMMQVIVTNPLEVVKVKMQTSSMTAKEVMQELDNPMDLYNGASACLVRDMLFSAILFPLYQQLKLLLLPIFAAGLLALAGGPDAALAHAVTSADTFGETAAFWSDLVAGSLAAGPAAVLSTPADVIKTRIQQARQGNENQIMNGENVAKGAVVYPSFQGKDAGFFQVGSTIVAQEGIMVLGSGWLERVVRSTPQFGVTLALFDVLNGLAVEYGWLAEGQ